MVADGAGRQLDAVADDVVLDRLEPKNFIVVGGIAPGIDRIVMLICGEDNLREVVLFPMNQKAEDLMMGAPSEVSPKQLRELHIRLDLPKKSPP